MSVEVTPLPGLEQAASHMPFDQFGRYHMLREAVDACRALLRCERLSILDVGGFYDNHGTPTLPLAQFLPDDDLTVLDVVECDLPAYIKGDGTALHFDDASFDLVVSADTLEHISGPQREQFWRELLRVARHGVILLAPFATPGVAEAEAVLFEYIKAELHAEHQQLKEHREYGLPRLDRWMAFLEEEGMPARAYPTGYLHAWLGMMLLKHLLLRIDNRSEAQEIVDGYYNRYFFPTERRTPAYRHLIVVEKASGILDAVDAAIAPTIMPDVKNTSVDWGMALGPTMVALVQRRLALLQEQQAQEAATHKHTVDHLATQLAAAQADAANARVELIAVRKQLAATQNDELVQEQREQIHHLRQQVSMIERILADQQITNSRLCEQVVHTQAQLGQSEAQVHQVVTQYEAALRDLTERAAWQERKAVAARQELEAVQRGRVLRLLNYISRRTNA